MPERSPLVLEKVIFEKKKKTKVHSLQTSTNAYCKYEIENGNIIKVMTSAQGCGEVIQRNKFIILRLSGTQFEMGYQHGFLLAQEINEPIKNPSGNIKLYPDCNQLKFWADYIDEDLIKPLLPGFEEILTPIVRSALAPVAESAVFADRIPDDIFRALYGVYSGYKKGLEVRIKEKIYIPESELSFTDFVKGYVLPDMVNIFIRRGLGKQSPVNPLVKAFLPDSLDWSDSPIGTLGCSTVAFLPGKTENGALLFGNDFDYAPLAGLWEKNLAVVFCDPLPEDSEGQHDPTVPTSETPQDYLFITSAGMHTGLVGVNQSGVAFRVHNNFTRDTDGDFEDMGEGSRHTSAHGQPLLNFCDCFLRFSKNIAGNSNEFTNLKNSIRERINCVGPNVLVTNTPASGWTFLLAQPKKSADTDLSKIIIYETTFSNSGPAEIPVRYQDKPLERFNLIKDLKEIEDGEAIKAIWQTNFYTSENLKEFEIFLTRSSQLNNLNRFLRIGLEVRKRYVKGKITWQNVADILADDRDVFSGSGDGARRLNISTVAWASTITTVVYSILPGQDGGKPEIKFFLAQPPDKKTPVCWGRFYEFSFEKLVKAHYGDNVIKDCQWNTSQHGNDDEYFQAFVPFYKAYCHYTFNEEDDRDYKFLIGKIDDARKKLGATNQAPSKEPFLDYLLGRLHISNKDLKNALDYLEKCLVNTSNIYDPHLITMTNYFIAKVCYALYIETSDTKYNKRAWDALNDLNKDIFYEKINLTDELYEAIKPYLKPPFPASPAGKKLKYIKDNRLSDSIIKLRQKQQCNLKDIETEISFDAIDLNTYKT